MEKDTIIRFYPNEKNGLTNEQVEERNKQQLVNVSLNTTTKSSKQIIKENVLTLFNIINAILALAVISVGSFKNMMFIIIVIVNTCISTFQELHSKHVLDKLSVISQHKVKVVRDRKEIEISKDELVLDDIIHFELGNQVLTDAIIQSGQVLVNESFITGEVEPINKKEQDMILSGSFIVSGSCYAKVEHIGYENYTAKMTEDTKYMKPVSSEIMRSLNKIVKIISCIIFPLGILLFARQYFLANNTLQMAVINTVAALIGMIPEGLVLLTSTVFAVSVIRLSKSKVLVQDLYCIETLARVDTICLDKTGTLTEGVMEVSDLICTSDKNKHELADILGMIMASVPADNPTSKALKKAFYSHVHPDLKEVISFSSIKKYSGIILQDNTAYVIGAAEFILKDQMKKYQKQIEELSTKGRVIVLTKAMMDDESLTNVQLLGFILLQDKIRKDAKDTLEYFRQQEVNLKIISGDHPLTVQMIAQKAGFKENATIVDMSQIEDEQIPFIVEQYDIFGRVKPDQKHLIIKSLKEKGHTVAMTGDGVNDCLALKEADCSIAMASGSDAARSVSQLVLLDSNFSAMPMIVAEGRRSINNLERSASLFLVKTIYASLLAFIFLFVELPYPFIPIQLTLTSALTIGIPSFILALEPNHDRIKGNFLKNVLKKAIPPAFVIVVNIILVCCIGPIFKLSYAKISTLCLTLTGYTSFILLYKICQPLNRIRLLLFFIMFYVFVYALLNLTTLFSISHFTNLMVMIIFALMFVSHQLYELFETILSKLLNRTSNFEREKHR